MCAHDPVKEFANKIFRDDDLSNNTDSLRSEVDSENQCKLCKEIEFSDYEPEEEIFSIKKVTAMNKYKPNQKKLNRATERQYFEAIANNPPDLDKQQRLKEERLRLKKKF